MTSNSSSNLPPPSLLSTFNQTLFLGTFIPLFLLATIPPMLNFLFGGNKFPVKGRLVVVTGASQGMGLAVAKELVRKGASVAIIARDRGKLEKAKGEIEAEIVRGEVGSEEEQPRVAWFSADLAKAVEVQKVMGEVMEWWGKGVPDIVWMCAGASHPGLFTEVSSEILESQVQVNYMSALYTAHTTLKLMTSSPLPPSAPPRHLIFTSSVLAFLPLTGYSPYTPSKAAIRALADSLRQECLLYNISVHCCFPGTIYTPGFEFEQSVKPAITKKLEEGDSGQTPEEVARVCISKLEKGQTNIVSSFIGEAMRGTAWGASKKGNVLVDTVMIVIASLVWLYVGWDMDRTVRAWGRAHSVGAHAGLAAIGDGTGKGKKKDGESEVGNLGEE